MIPFLFLCYSSGTSIPKESFLREKLSEFGTINSVLMRPSYNSNLKSFVLVEYLTVEEAMACRTAYTVEDENCMKKLKLGDKRLEVNILIGSKVMRPFEANILPSTTSTSYPQSSFVSLDYTNPQAIPGVKPNQIQGQPQVQNQTFINLVGQMNTGYQSNNINDEIRLIFDSDFIKEKKAKDIVYPTFPIGGCTMDSGKNSPLIFEVMNKIQPTAKPKKLLETDLSPSEEIVQQYIEDNYTLFWSGFITKGLKNNVGVDGYFMTGDYQLASEEIFTLRIHNMNVSHKSNVEEVLSRPCLALVVMVPSNPTQKARFHEYRSYFRDKKIIGIVNHFKNKILYIFPYYDELKELLGGLKDGLYMVGMISEIVKKDEILPRPDMPANSQEAQPSQEGGLAVNVDSTSQDIKEESIQNELVPKNKIEEIEEDPAPSKRIAEVIIEEITVDTDTKANAMNEEEVVVDESPQKLFSSPTKAKASSEPIEIEEPVTEDVT